MSILEITPSTQNSGMFTWKVPSNLKSKANYSILINATDNSAHAYSKPFALIIRSGIPGFQISWLVTGFILICFCMFLRTRYKVKIN